MSLDVCLSRLATGTLVVSVACGGVTAPADDSATGSAGQELSRCVAPGDALVTTANLRLRTGPGASYATLAIAPQDTTVTPLSGCPQNGWYRVSSEGRAGWLSGLYLKVGSVGVTSPLDPWRLGVELYLVYWPSFGGTANEAELSSFMTCLIGRSTWHSFFQPFGGVSLKWGGSVHVSTPPPSQHFGICDNDVSYVNGLIGDGQLPKASDGYLPLYLFMVPSGLRATSCWNGGACSYGDACGELCLQGVCGLNPGARHQNGSISWLEGWVTTYASCCWLEGRTDLNVETETLLHEASEEISAALGVPYGSTVGDGCEVDTAYGFPGCPSQEGRPADWYVLQKLSNQGNGSCNFQTAL